MEQLARTYETDINLAARVASGDRNATIQLSERLFEKIRLSCWYLAGMDRDFDDLVQLSLMEVLKSIPSYQGRSSLETWAERIAVRTSLRYLRHRRSREALVQPGVEREGSSFETGERYTGQRQLHAALHRLLSHIKEDRRMVLVLRFVYRHSIEEIAELTQSPVNTVRDRLRVGKAKLLKLMRNDPALRDWLEESSS